MEQILTSFLSSLCLTFFLAKFRFEGIKTVTVPVKQNSRKFLSNFSSALGLPLFSFF